MIIGAGRVWDSGGLDLRVQGSCFFPDMKEFV